MDKESVWRARRTLAGGYARARLPLLLLLGGVLLLFLIVYLLYHIDFGAFGYAAVLAAVFIAGFAAVDFRRYARRHMALMHLRHSISAGLYGLPEAASLLEADYQALLSLLHEDRMRLQSEADSQRTELTDYITLWTHQIKTPIAAMRLLLQEREEPCGELEDELFQTEQYVGMVLQYLRVDGLSADLLLKEYPLDSLVRQAVRRLSPLFIRQKLALRLEDLPGTVLTDERWFVFVLEQLLTNALKYTPAGHIAIHTEGSPPQALIIEDTGIGIRAEDLPRIFEKGFTGLNGRTDKRSTGIGLYLCKRTLDRLGHSIAVTSAPGEGTAVRLGLNRPTLEIE